MLLQDDVHMGDISLFRYKGLVLSPFVYTRLEALCLTRFGSLLSQVLF